MMTQLHKFLTVSSQERLLFGQAFGLLAGVRLGLWTLPFRRVNALVQWATAQVTYKTTTPPVSTAQVTRAIETATRYQPGQARCLARAMAAQILFQQYGYACDLRIGVAKNELQHLTAHAWLEHHGQVLIGGDLDLLGFTPLPSLVAPNQRR